MDVCMFALLLQKTSMTLYSVLHVMYNYISIVCLSFIKSEVITCGQYSN